MGNVKISIILPSYNSEKFLSESIKSVLGQTLKDFELIIIDDGSKDKSLKIAEGFAKKDNRIKLLKNKNNLGLQKTLNLGLKYSKGKYIARMDADDIMDRSRLEKQFNYLEKNKEIFLVGSSAKVIDESGIKIGIFKKFNNFKKIKNKMVDSNTMIHPSVMFRNNFGFFYREKFKSSEDYDLFLRMISSGKKITNLPEELISYRIYRKSFVFTMPNQEFYFKKAKEFYFQRISSGKDNYDSLIGPTKKISKKINEVDYLYLLSFVEILDGNGNEARKNLKLIFTKTSFSKNLVKYLIMSFVPKRILWFLQRIF